MAPTQKETRLRQQFAGPVIVGKDILELVSSAMYVDPLTIYREYVQNAADAIDDAEMQGLYTGGSQPRIDITFDNATRTATVRDNGTGIPPNWVARRLSSLGASSKRGKGARGFRGVGRLSGLAYCQELVFRTKVADDDRVYEMHWDCRKLKELLRDHETDADLNAIFHAIVTVDSISSLDYPPHFFEVELRHVVRHKNDLLLNEAAIRHYLAQVGPVPFSPQFPLGCKIQQFLDEFSTGKSYRVFVNDNKSPIVRPFQSDFEIKRGIVNSKANLETFQIPGISNGENDAIGWLLNHDYLGALSDHLGIKGLRIRVGNIQIGDANTLQGVFPEPRFNSWAIGEIHVLNPRLVPNGRRDDFEQNTHYTNLITHITPKAKGIAKACRTSSAERAQQRKQSASALGGVNGTQIDWFKAKRFLTAHADKPLTKAHRKSIRQLVSNGTATYYAVMHTLLDSNIATRPIRDET
jgi:molecular chaperone HtpG